MIGIYSFINKKNGKRYIGQSIHVEKRRKQHLKYAKDGCDGIFYRALRKYGDEGFDFEVLMDLSYLKSKSDEEINTELNNWERYYIAYYKTNIYRYGPKFGYNQNDGGTGGNLGEEVNKRIAESERKYFKTHNVWNKGLTKETDDRVKQYSETQSRTRLGLHPSEETRQKMSKKRLGMKMGPEFGDKIRQIRLGTKRSDETRKKLSDKKSGYTWMNNGLGDTKQVFTEEEKEYYKSLGWKIGRGKIKK